jgi:hypothetical protein
MSELRVRLTNGPGVATYPAGATFGPRRLSEFEWVWGIDGHARYRHNGLWVEAPPGSVALCHAAMLLERTNFSVGEVARQCGFASPFHFSRQFKAAFGDAPQRLRARVRAGEMPPLPRLLQSHR